MDSSKDVKVESQEKNTAIVNGEKVNTNNGEVLGQKAETNVSENKKTEKRPMTEFEAREYVSKLGFKHANIKELYEVMQVPSCSKYEFRMASYIILWARKNGVDYNFDKKGNIYLTKGTLEKGEFYPCVTSHMDSVQDKAKPFALAGAELPLRTRRVKSTTTDEVRHEIYIDGQGIGADDKLGVYISLQIVKNIDKIKAVFFVEEEIGMLGSKELEKEFFEDVAYVIGWDSPDLIRAAWKCSGTQLFTADFYKKHLKPVTDKWGFNDRAFHSEPFTDVVQIREKTGIMCMNFGNGGYQAHSATEFLVIEHVDHALGMGIDIVKTIGNKEQFKFTKTYNRTTSGTGLVASYDDERECEKLFGTYYSSYNSNTNYNSNTQTNRSDGNVNASVKDNSVNEETVKYIVDTYDEYIKAVKEEIDAKCGVIEDALKDKFREAGIDFSTFNINIKKELSEVFSKEIKF